jgi:hypothetical protein
MRRGSRRPRQSSPLAATATPPTGVTPKLRRWVEPLPVPLVFDGTAGDTRFTIAAGESTTYA